MVDAVEALEVGGAPFVRALDATPCRAQVDSFNLCKTAGTPPRPGEKHAQDARAGAEPHRGGVRDDDDIASGRSVLDRPPDQRTQNLVEPAARNHVDLETGQTGAAALDGREQFRLESLPLRSSQNDLLVNKPEPEGFGDRPRHLFTERPGRM